MLTLSDRFSIALCTKPPIPFVGEAGRSGEIRPCARDIVIPLPEPIRSSASSEPASEGATSPCESGTEKTGFESLALSPDMDVASDILLLQAALPRTEPACDGELERALAGGGLVASSDSTVDSLDIPGSCLLPDNDPVSDALSS